MNYCRFCGKHLPRSDGRFCPYCGKNLTFEGIRTEVDTLHKEKVPEKIAPADVPFTSREAVLTKSARLPDSVLHEEAHTEHMVDDIPNELFVRRYRFIKRIGHGNMSEVYQAEDIEHANKIVAVKLLNTRHKDVIKQEMYLRETRALEQLEHPNIIKHLDYGWSDERRCHYIVLEYLPHTLVDEIALHNDSREQDWCWPLMRDITDALVHAHSKGIVHRDLKSTNILISEVREKSHQHPDLRCKTSRHYPSVH